MKFGSRNIYTVWMGVLAVGVIACLFTLIFASCSHGKTVLEDNIPSAAETQTVAPATVAPAAPAAPVEPAAPIVSAGARLTETPDAGLAYQDKFIFLGDSTTHGLQYYGMLSGGEQTTQVWTPASGTLTLAYWKTATIVYPETGEELSIEDAVAKKQPEYMLVTLGVNGISFMTKEEFVSCYREMLNAIQSASPNTKIIINSIYPIAAGYPHQDQINNDKICAANAWLEDLANEKGIAFLNCYDSLLGTDTYLDKDLHNGDYIHLNSSGYQVVLKELRTHEYK